ncbi:hypothetical protein E1B28_008873 [Marasmius oreades]|uniref:RlpA-like protein double-psi beta-barrel domain-containing protein n=1 Tax=Marasmius oreades TaxID=181124 RepID=A0A9P7USJ8_9AGAR|nr:uncharacterized protein E1B28_008873 [Marasmius oreades]KAG7092523.1 hypothetical protein E1B28_008873 [Marasmius oreades]
MVASLSFITLALSALSLVSARAIPRQTQSEDCSEGHLEDHNTYRTRYIQLGCSKQHGTPFFDLCCHPMLATENLKDNRDPSCDPANASSSSSSSLATSTTTTAEPTQTAVSNLGDDGQSGDSSNKDDLDDCDDDEDNSDDGDDETCDDDDESQAPTSSTADDTSSATGQQAPPTSTAEQQTTSTVDQQAPPTSTTEQQAPPTSTTEEQAPPTSTDTPPPTTTTTSQESQPTQSQGNQGDGGNNNGNNGGGDIQSGGFATWFTQDNNPGACGTVHSDNDLIAAMSTERYGDTGKTSDLCGKQVSITNASNGKSVVVTVTDACPGCKNGNSIDLSLAAFQALDDLGVGLIDIKWNFL